MISNRLRRGSLAAGVELETFADAPKSLAALMKK
jgi:hypothetical protein